MVVSMVTVISWGGAQGAGEWYLEWNLPCLALCSCWMRVFSIFTGLGMKPISQPSFTRRPIHQSLLNFYGEKVPLEILLFFIIIIIHIINIIIVIHITITILVIITQFSFLIVIQSTLARVCM